MHHVNFHFLDVGHGDCTIIDFPGRLTMVDINNCKALDDETETEIRNRDKRPNPQPPVPFQHVGGAPSLGGGGQTDYFRAIIEGMAAATRLKDARDKLTDPIDYLRSRFPGKAIFRYIQTHPDMDHMAGLYRMCKEEQISIENFWDTSHRIEKDEVAMRTGAVNHDVRDWHTYLELRNSASNPTVLRLAKGAKANFYQQDGISIWAPFNHNQKDNSEANPNDLSYVLCVSIGQCNVLLGGDATTEMWESLYEANKGNLPKIHLFKAPHHGRKSGYHMKSVKAMNPDITVVSTGELKDKHDAAASYEKYSNKGCYSTVDHGNLMATCWSDGDVWVYDREMNRII